MNKREIVRKIAISLGLTKRQAEYNLSFILDLIILEAERTGKVKIDSHVFYKRTISERTWNDVLHGVERKTPAINLVSYRNTKRFRKSNASKIHS
jgi:nucleoid DNA-binding protein